MLLPAFVPDSQRRRLINTRTHARTPGALLGAAIARLPHTFSRPLMSGSWTRLNYKRTFGTLATRSLAKTKRGRQMSVMELAWSLLRPRLSPKCDGLRVLPSPPAAPLRATSRRRLRWACHKRKRNRLPSGNMCRTALKCSRD